MRRGIISAKSANNNRNIEGVYKCLGVAEKECGKENRGVRKPTKCEICGGIQFELVGVC